MCIRDRALAEVADVGSHSISGYYRNVYLTQDVKYKPFYSFLGNGETCLLYTSGERFHALTGQSVKPVRAVLGLPFTGADIAACLKDVYKRQVHRRWCAVHWQAARSGCRPPSAPA